ncbi:hypothetical protein L484_023707 [Morus notabilis]|uniref:Uncharacterized protein n=1 Tax=Morus notabilis TaxID=981085 RepID=W9QQP7_9ROSA|nr:hypothetical protein L484_023707 [Morus notabilis]
MSFSRQTLDHSINAPRPEEYGSDIMSMRGGDLAGNLLRTLLRRELQQLWVDEKTGKAIRRLKAYGSWS